MDDIDRIKQIELFAWVGEDEHGSGEIGLKQALVPAGFIPLVGVRRKQMERPDIVYMMDAQGRLYNKNIRLCRFVFAEVLYATGQPKTE